MLKIVINVLWNRKAKNILKELNWEGPGLLLLLIYFFSGKARQLCETGEGEKTKKGHKEKNTANLQHSASLSDADCTFQSGEKEPKCTFLLAPQELMLSCLRCWFSCILVTRSQKVCEINYVVWITQTVIKQNTKAVSLIRESKRGRAK